LLAYRNTEPGGDIPPQSTLSVFVSQPAGPEDQWDELPNLIHSDDSDENGDHFVVETDENGRSLIRFGNGINGKVLPQDSEVRCEYQFGAGADGNIGADKLIFFDPATLSGPPSGTTITACWNPFDVANGRAPEPVAEIIRRVPEAYRARQLRAITLKDYVDRAEQLSEVSRAAASYAWTGSWRTVRVTIDPRGTDLLEAPVREKIARHLDAVRLIGEDLEIRPPRFVPLELSAIVCAHPEYWPEDIESILEQEFSTGYTPDGRMAFFHPDLWTFGQTLHQSEILGRIQKVVGVDHVKSVTILRWNEQTNFDADHEIKLQPNEIIQVLNDPDHMEKGSITFFVKGGRS
jgi:predicted phage baseplate assembly protein